MNYADPTTADEPQMAKAMAYEKTKQRSIGSNTVASKPEGRPIALEIDSQSELLVYLEDAVSNLETTLSPVLSGSYPMEDINAEPRGESGAYQALNANNRKIANITIWLTQIRKRLEV